MLRNSYIRYKLRRRQAVKHKKVFLRMHWVRADFRYRVLLKHLHYPLQRQIENFPITKIGGLFRPKIHFLDQYRKILMSEQFELEDCIAPRINYSSLFRTFYSNMYPYTKYYKSIFQSYKSSNLDLFFSIFWRTHWYYNNAYHLPREHYAVTKQKVIRNRKKIEGFDYSWWGMIGEIHMTYVNYKKRDLQLFLYL